jgi:hypothetical protein
MLLIDCAGRSRRCRCQCAKLPMYRGQAQSLLADSLFVGTWGTGVFSNDTAADVREDFRDLVAGGLDAATATSRLAAEFGLGVDADVDNDFWLAMAVTQHRLGRITQVAVENAIRVVDDPSELERWANADRRKRQAVLTKVRETLQQPVPPPKRVRTRSKVDTGLRAGQHVRWRLNHGKPDVLLRVIRVHEDKGGRYPVVITLDWDGSERKAREAHRLRAMPGGEGTLREGDALGFMLCGRPNDPPDLEILDARSDKRTPSVGFNHSQWVIPWTDIHRFVAKGGGAASVREATAHE